MKAATTVLLEHKSHGSAFPRRTHTAIASHDESMIEEKATAEMNPNVRYTWVD